MSKKSTGRQRKISVELPKTLNEEFIHDLFSCIPTDFRGTYLCSEVLSKFNGPSGDSADLRRSRAISKWLETERRNSRTNHRLYTSSTVFKTKEHGELDSDRLICTVRKFVSDILGPLKWYPGSFSAGASTSRKRGESSPAEKFSGEADVTLQALPAWAHETFMVPRLGAINPRIVKGNLLFTVPKNSTIDRVACKEPDLNMYLQKGVGDYVRKRLRTVGINLNDQTRNQRLAKQGSIDGSLATIDLSSASDSVTTQLACLLLDPDWFDLLMSLRSPTTYVDGVMHENEMLSSMGNGFTFEVESLFFYAIARAVAYHSSTKGTISVYGDDIIVPNGTVKLLSQVMGFLGFIMNPKKSHSTGFFRESCGAHWYKGRCVKPFYIRRPVSSIPDLILHLNAVRRWFAEDGVWVSSTVYDFWSKYARYVPYFLWGGRDYTSNETLVSRKGKGKRLMAVIDNRQPPQEGGFVAWLRATYEREEQTCVNIKLSRFAQRYVIRPGREEQYRDYSAPTLVFAEEYP